MHRLVPIWGLVALLSLAAGPSFAQFGRFPFPGRNPVGLPSPVPGPKQPRNGKQKPAEEPRPDFKGTLRSISGNNLTVETADSNTLEFHVSKKTKFYDGKKKVKPASLKAGDAVSVEARQAPDGSLEAVSVTREHPKSSNS